MVDTGSTCNIAFETLTKKFPFVELLKTDQTVEGVGGLTATVLGKLYISLTIGRQTLMEPFLLSDYPISNLDGIIGTSTLKRFHTWSLGGSPTTGAHLEINGVALQLRGFGTNNGTKIAISLIGPDGTTTPTDQERTCYTISSHMTIDCTGHCENLTDIPSEFSYQTDTTHQQLPTNSTTTHQATELDTIRTTLTSYQTTKSIPDLTTRPQDHSVQIQTDPITMYQPTESATIPTTPTNYQTTNSIPNRTSQSQNYSVSEIPKGSKGEINKDKPSPGPVSTGLTSVNKSNYPETTEHHYPAIGRGSKPHYSALFVNSQWKPHILGDHGDDREDLPTRQRIYATQSVSVSPKGHVQVTIQIEGAFRQTQYLFTPYFDQSIHDLVNINSRNPWAASLTLINHTDKTREWQHGSFMGFLEEIEEVLSPTHICTGDPIFGREETKWYEEGPGDDILLSLASVNQQVNFYEAGDGSLLAGPAPDAPRVCQVNLAKLKIDTNDPKPIVVAGDFRERHLFGPHDVIACQTNSSTVTSHGLSRVIENSYPYNSIYHKKTTKRNLLPDEDLRPLGACLLRGETNSPNPLIGNLIGQFFYGAPINKNGGQEGYLAKFIHQCSSRLREGLLKDTRENRIVWFKQALEDLFSQVKSLHTAAQNKIRRIFFPYWVGHTGKQSNDEEYRAAINEFTRKAATIGVIVYLVLEPEENLAIHEGKYPCIQPAKVPTSKHTAGGYRDLPSTFCKDPKCQGCPSNKGILNILKEKVGDDELEDRNPMSGILDGMSPDIHIPSADTQEEREQLFEELLKEIRIGDLSPPQLEQVKDLLRNCSKLFITSDDEPAGMIRGLEVDIPTTGPPIYSKMRKFNPRALRIMEELNATMLRKGLTRPCDGPWSSPVVLVKKKPIPGQRRDGEDSSNYRFCIDYRAINAQRLVWKVYPVPLMKSQIQRAAGYRYYSTVDITSAFHCVQIREDSQQVTAFALPSGLFCFTRLPFGLSISPQIWAKAVDTILKPVRELCSYYADDIIGHSNTFEDHLADMKKILMTLMSSGVKIQLSKCQFFMADVVWLGHKISMEGISPDPKGIETVQQLRPPRNRQELQSVIGTLNYFKDFIDGYTDILIPLSKLLKKTKLFEWGNQQNEALQAIKEALTSDKVLVKPDFDQDFFLQCDASDYAVGAILSQKDNQDKLRPIQYWSKKMNSAELNYSATEKEALAVFLSFKKFEQYLLLNTTHILTDAAALKAFYGTREIASKRVLRWALFVGQFHHTITHVRGVENDLADLCSRCVEYPEQPVPNIVVVTQSCKQPPLIKSIDIRRFQELEEPWKGTLSMLRTTAGREAETGIGKNKETYAISDQDLLCIKDKDRLGIY